MAGALATKTILDSTGATVTMRVWDESGVGTGPFSFVSYISSQSVNQNVNGGAPVAVLTDAANVGKVEDVASSNADAGIPAMAIRQASPADSSSTDGDYEMLRIKDGRLLQSRDDSVIYNGTTILTPKFAKITASSSGATTIVAAVTSKKIRVLAWDVKVNAAVNFKWQSHVTPTDLTGLYYNSGQGDGVARAFNPLGYFETVAGEALDINLSGAVAVGGVLTYVEV